MLVIPSLLLPPVACWCALLFRLPPRCCSCCFCCSCCCCYNVTLGVGIITFCHCVVALVLHMNMIWEREQEEEREWEREREEVAEAEAAKQCKLRLQSRSPCTAFPCPDSCLPQSCLVGGCYFNFIYMVYGIFFRSQRAALRVHSTFIISKQINVAHMWHHFMRRVYLFYGIIISLAVWQGERDGEEVGKGEGRGVSLG